MLIVEDGSLSTPSANTYATQSYVATYCSDHGLTEWAALASDSLEEQAIHRAMSYLEGLTYKGYKVEYDQRLRWPRGGVYDEPRYRGWCRTFAERYDVVTISVNYLQSGAEGKLDTREHAYDFGYLQAMDRSLTSPVMEVHRTLPR